MSKRNKDEDSDASEASDEYVSDPEPDIEPEPEPEPEEKKLPPFSYRYDQIVFDIHINAIHLSSKFMRHHRAYPGDIMKINLKDYSDIEKFIIDETIALINKYVEIWKHNYAKANINTKHVEYYTYKLFSTSDRILFDEFVDKLLDQSTDDKTKYTKKLEKNKKKISLLNDVLRIVEFFDISSLLEKLFTLIAIMIFECSYAEVHELI